MDVANGIFRFVPEHRGSLERWPLGDVVPCRAISHYLLGRFPLANLKEGIS
jgi:hypothetical protein